MNFKRAAWTGLAGCCVSLVYFGILYTWGFFPATCYACLMFGLAGSQIFELIRMARDLR